MIDLVVILNLFQDLFITTCLIQFSKINFKEIPKVGLEPTRCCHRWILNPLRLPFRHSGTNNIMYIHIIRRNLKFKPMRGRNLRKTYFLNAAYSRNYSGDLICFYYSLPQSLNRRRRGFQGEVPLTSGAKRCVFFLFFGSFLFNRKKRKEMNKATKLRI